MHSPAGGRKKKNNRDPSCRPDNVLHSFLESKLRFIPSDPGHRRGGVEESAIYDGRK